MLKNNYKPSFYSRLLFYFMTFYLLFGLGSAMLVFKGYRENVRQMQNTHECWLKTYGETFFSDIVLGNSIAVENRLNILVQRALAEEATLTFGRNKIHSVRKPSNKSKPKDWLGNVILRLLPKNTLNIQVTDTSNTTWASLRVTLDPAMLYQPITHSIKQFIVYGISFFLIGFALMLFFIEKLAIAVQCLADYINSFSKNASRPSEVETLLAARPELDIEELAMVAQEFNTSVMHLLRLQKEMEQHQAELAVAGIARQVAHDIRSPLAALDSITRDMSQLSEEKRIIIRSAVARIRDIANHLLEKNRTVQDSNKAGVIQTGTVESVANEPCSVELLSSLLDPLITEKRMQYRSRIGIEIQGRLDSASYGIFASIQPVEFKRVISNLINNSVEATEEKGTVSITVSARNGEAHIRVEDNGKGIPPDILGKLGQKGETHGKTGGSGLGLYHARTMVESWGGSLSISSELGMGTTTTLCLPQAEPPEWFVSNLEILPGSVIAILDDDTSIHQIWQGRFDSMRFKEHGMEVHHFSMPDELRGFVRENRSKAETAHYLTDFELLGYQETGLSLVEELGLGNRAILVTSRFEEKRILSECRRLNVRMIPKGLAGFVPITIPMLAQRKQLPINTRPVPIPHVVLLDDDPLVRMNWKLAAKMRGLNFLAFEEPHAMLEARKEWPKEIEIYLDSMLGEGVKGEDIARTLRLEGFSNLHLATGFDRESFVDLPWIKSIVGKEPPWQ